MIHPTAVIADTVRLGEDVTVGPYTVIEGEVEIGDGCCIGPHCHILGFTVIGPGTQVHAGAVIGDAAQDYGCKGERSYVRIAANCIIREYVTIHRGNAAETETIIGENCMLMAFAHVAHNCILGKRVVIANLSVLSGHVEIGDRAIISGYVGLHQFVRIGELAMVGGHLKLTQDVPPYCLAAKDNRVSGPNTVGLKRAGFPEDSRKAIRNAVRTFFYAGLSQNDALAAIAEKHGDSPEIQHFIEFIKASKRGICNPRLRPRPDSD